MSIRISPLDLLLDNENPRFVFLANKEQADIRFYLLTYEDVCPLANAINSYGRILPGERVVVLKNEEDKYVVIEGNRRTCCLQLLLDRSLIPHGFTHKIKPTNENILDNCETIEVDILPDRNSALELMTKRHIEGVKQWKPIAKKQFFASSFHRGQSIKNLSSITGITPGEIRTDIKDYNFFLSNYNKYALDNPDFDREIIGLKIDPFLRIFTVRFRFNDQSFSPTDFLKLSQDANLNTQSTLPNELFEEVVQLVFKSAVVEETVNTRSVLTDVPRILPLLEKVEQTIQPAGKERLEPKECKNKQRAEAGKPSNTDVEAPADCPVNGAESKATPGASSTEAPLPPGPPPGGPGPRCFFENLSWAGKLDPKNREHDGLLFAINELYALSQSVSSKKKGYEHFPIAAGMVLRTTYEQALILRLKEVKLWSTYCATLNKKTFPTLSSIEDFISKNGNEDICFPEQALKGVFHRIKANKERQFLNANIHNPGDINTTPASLEGIALGGMFSLIQGLINLL